MKNHTNSVKQRVRRLSVNQLRALFVLTENKYGLVTSDRVEAKLGLTGKALGGVFSSLSRQKIDGMALVTPFGQAQNSRGLRWRLNTELISVQGLRAEVKQVLKYAEVGI